MKAENWETSLVINLVDDGLTKEQAEEYVEFVKVFVVDEARREGVEAVIEAIKPWLIGLDSVPWEDEVEEKLSDVRSKLLNN